MLSLKPPPRPNSSPRYGQLGVARVLTDSWSLRASAIFQHLSNGGATHPNSGLDALGFTLGVSRSF
ncbi:acyloxyacyl hydrolase [Prosthecobacter sp.]